MIEVSFTFRDIINHVVELIYSKCVNIGNNYKNLPNSIKKGYSITTYGSRGTYPTGHFDYQGDIPIYIWTITDYIPNATSYTKETIFNELKEFTHKEDVLDNKVSSNEILGFLNDIIIFLRQKVIIYRQEFQLNGYLTPATYICYLDSQATNTNEYVTSETIIADQPSKIIDNICNTIKGSIITKTIKYTTELNNRHGGSSTNYTITVKANLSAGIKNPPTGGGTYTDGTVVYIGADLNDGWGCIGWNDDKTITNPKRQIFVRKNYDYVLYVAQNVVDITYTISPDNSGTITFDKDYYKPGDTMKATAVPNDGYNFLRWEVYSKEEEKLCVDYSNPLIEKFKTEDEGYEVSCFFKNKNS